MDINVFAPKLVSIQISDPLFTDSQWAKGNFRENVAHRLAEWQQDTAADGGYLTATLTLTGTQEYIEEWLSNGLGRHVEIYDDGFQLVWEGFVNQITGNLGPDQITIGPLSDVANRVLVAYTVIENGTVNPPVIGSNKRTTFAEDAGSKSRYGTRERIVNGGNLLDDTSYQTPGNEAEQVRGAFLGVSKKPQANRGLAVGGADQVSVTLECVGYHDMLNCYYYEPVAGGYTTYTDKIKAILAATPNAIFSADQSLIETNASLTMAADEGRLAREVIAEISRQGDASLNRWIWGFTSGRRFYYRSVSKVYTYLLKGGNVFDLTGRQIYPWQIRAGVWAYAQNSQREVGAGSIVDEADPFSMFIESVSFTLPYSATLTSARVSTLLQLLAQKGIGLA